MVTGVVISACCSEEKEVVIEVSFGVGCEPEVTVIQNGESHALSVYDSKVVSVKEVEKETEGTTEEV